MKSGGKCVTAGLAMVKTRAEEQRRQKANRIWLLVMAATMAENPCPIYARRTLFLICS